MNIDSNRIKELVLIYAELNEDYQKRLMCEAYKLQLMQSQLNNIQKENTTFKNEQDLENEVKRRTNEVAKEILDLAKFLKQSSDTDKAAVILMMNRLAGRENIKQQTDITITINERNISMKEYLEMYLVGADYDEAKSLVDQYLEEIEDRK